MHGSTTQKWLVCRELCCCFDCTPSQAHPNDLSVILRTATWLYSVGNCLCHRKYSYWSLSKRIQSIVRFPQELDLQWWLVMSFEAPAAAENSLLASCCVSQHFPRSKDILLVLCPASWALLQQWPERSALVTATQGYLHTTPNRQ